MTNRILKQDKGQESRRVGEPKSYGSDKGQESRRVEEPKGYGS